MIALAVVLGAVAIAAGVLVFVVDSMARATYALLVSFVAVGLLLVAVGLDYLGPITILMMAMEMAVMGLFMIMFMGMNPALMAMDMTHAKRPTAIVAVAVFVGLAAAILTIPWPERAAAPAGDRVAALGVALMESKMLVMLTVSPVLLATIVVAVVLANPRGRYDRFGDDLEAPADDPEAGGL
ncbi:NADH-quinone oxidoreductase subunit J [Amnibacterium endophyticum]|uniref:NADH-quinone oxidoreductase subunit J n=1 Tax=Amnibacterium endophyticum TaxID=2109337 RepID=A0ABW4LIT9_9MICO